MAIILLFTSAAFTNWISSRFSTATTSSFNPYLVDISELVKIKITLLIQCLYVGLSFLGGTGARYYPILRRNDISCYERLWSLNVSLYIGWPNITAGWLYDITL
jgi:hypothetical protein